MAGPARHADPNTDVPAKFIDAIGMKKLLFEAADPDVFAWYIENYGADVNLFVDHSPIVQLECLRAGIWGTKSSWGRVGLTKTVNSEQWLTIRDRRITDQQ